MTDLEYRRETGASLMFVGLAVWVAALLVLFYLPAAQRIGHQGIFGWLIGALAALGAVLMVRGWWMRRA